VLQKQRSSVDRARRETEAGAEPAARHGQGRCHAGPRLDLSSPALLVIWGVPPPDPAFPPSLGFCFPMQLPEALDQSWWHGLRLPCSMLASSCGGEGGGGEPPSPASTLLMGTGQGRGHPLAYVAAPCLGHTPPSPGAHSLSPCR